MKRTPLLFSVFGAILFFGLAQLMVESIFPISPLPIRSAGDGSCALDEGNPSNR